jgi:MraZ protein
MGWPRHRETNGEWMFRGSADAKIDEKGRLKIPSKFRSLLLEHYGPRVFVTSYGPPSMRLYPLAEWIKAEEILRKSGWGDDPRVVRFLRTVDLYGDEQEVDGQGRLLIHPRLRKHTRMEGEVVVLGHPTNLLEVWNEELLMQVQEQEPLTEETIRFVSNILREARDGNGSPPHSGDGPGGLGGPPA